MRASSVSPESKRLAVYGKTEFTPVEKDAISRHDWMRTEHIRKNHLADKGDGSGHFPGVRQWSAAELEQSKQTFCGPRTRRTVADVSTTYDRLFHTKYDYDSKLHRDDRRHVLEIGRAVHDEERKRKVPVLSSSQYGSRAHHTFEPFSRKYVCIEHILKGFYYKRGTGLPPIPGATRICD